MTTHIDPTPYERDATGRLPVWEPVRGTTDPTAGERVEWHGHPDWWPKQVHRADDLGNHDRCFRVSVTSAEPDPTAGDPCDTEHPDAGCSDVGCKHNCEAWVLENATPAEPNAGDVESLVDDLTEELMSKGYTHRSRYEVARWVVASDWLATARRKAGDDRAEQIAQAIEVLGAEFARRQSLNAAHNGGVSCSVWGIAGAEVSRAARIARESR